MEFKAEDSKGNISVKVLSSYMVRLGMNITDERHGDVKHELSLGSGFSFAGLIIDRRPE